MTNETQDFAIRQVSANGIDINVAMGGAGPAILFVHGWPHTWELWRPVMERFASEYTVIAPDLRGLGGSEKTEIGYDISTLADDLAALLEQLATESAVVVGIDLGAAISWMLAMRHPRRVRKLAVMEGMIGNLPGAEEFLKNGPPWWFGFHMAPGLGETVLDGNEAAYIDWFLKSGTKGRRGVEPHVRDAFVNAYGSKEAMRCGFEHYRAFPENARQVGEMVASGKSELPILAVAGGIVGAAIGRQLRAVSSDLTEVAIDDCAHLVPLEQPEALANALKIFIG
jgi:pimeloyl-ACP methyl ester carboxylesterase